jgi:5-formaminoimidazole-4-carboxamide-1-beta-D-ribofuranosyl 5'-monophosphate synthetase
MQEIARECREPVTFVFASRFANIKYNRNMSTGDLISLELKIAIRLGKMDKRVTLV